MVQWRKGLEQGIATVRLFLNKTWQLPLGVAVLFSLLERSEIVTSFESRLDSDVRLPKRELDMWGQTLRTGR